MGNEAGTNSSENREDVPPILGYGRPDSLRQRFNRLWPRLRPRSWALLLITVPLLIGFFHELPVWKSRSLTEGRSDRFAFESPTISIVPGDRRVVRAIRFPELEMLDLSNGYRPFSTQATDGQDIQMLFSKDGQRLVTRGKANNFVRLFDLNHLKPLPGIIHLSNQGYGQHECELSDDGTRLVVWSDDSVDLWDAENGKQLSSLQRNYGPTILDIRLTTDQRFAVVLRPDKADFYMLKDGTYDHSCSLPASFEQVVSHDGSTIVVAAFNDGKLHVLNANTGKERVAAIPIGNMIFQLAISRDDRRIIAADKGKMTLVDLTKGRMILTTPTPWPPGPGYLFTLSPDGRWLVLTSTTPTGMAIFIYDAQTLKQAAVIDGKYSSASRPFSPDGQRFVCVDNGEATATAWSTATWKPISRLHIGSGDGIWYLNDGTVLKAGPYGDLSIWSRHRPEAWYGPACVPIFWLALVAVILTLSRIGEDLWRWYHPRPT